MHLGNPWYRRDVATDLFVYGMLMSEDLLEALTGRRFETCPAVLHGFERLRVVKEGYPEFPGLVRREGVSVEGVLVRQVDEESLVRLDRFEEVETDLFRRGRVRVVDRDGGEWDAEVYLPGPDTAAALSGPWDPEQFLARS